MEEILAKLSEAFSGINILINVLDIIMIAVLLYLVFSFLIKKNTTRLIKYIVIGILGVAVLSCALTIFDIPNFKMAGLLAHNIIIILIIVIAILFAPELKRGLWKISSPKTDADIYSTQYNCSDEELSKAIGCIVKATQNMSKKNVGALIVIVPGEVQANILESGTRLSSVLSTQLLECLFNTKAPLHDGAVFIKGNIVLAAGCFLPLSQNSALDPELGTRHRAAIGMTETSNVISIIVSEETGIISVAKDGEITRYFDTHMLTDTLEQVYGLKAASSAKDMPKRRKRISK